MCSTSTIQAICVGWGLSVAKIGAMATSANTSGDPGLFNSFANHHTIFLELFSQNSIEEWVAARVQWQNEDCKDLGLFQGDEMQPKTAE